VFDAWASGVEHSEAAMREAFTQDCLWEQSGIPSTTGPDEAAQLILGMSAVGITRIDVEMRHAVSSGDVVFTERVDRMYNADGALVATFPVVGVTEFRDGKIRAWREYLDSAHYAQLAG
jgi:limonene-1,2-epoxide hydrolase